MNNQTTFANALLSYQKVYDIEPLFSDFLDLCLIILSPSALAGFPLDRDRFESILLKYSDPILPLDVTTLVSLLLKEMRCKQHLLHQGNSYADVLGDFYEEHILGYDPTNPFCSWELDEGLARSSGLTTLPPIDGDSRRKRRVLDELCGSGRRLLSRRWMHTIDTFYGVEIHPARAKMTILNLFLHNVPNVEVVCKKAGDQSYDFLFGYRCSADAPGIEWIQQKDSRLWKVIKERIAIAA